MGTAFYDGGGAAGNGGMVQKAMLNFGILNVGFGMKYS